MATTKVAILGASGMLGAMVLDHLSRDTRHEIIATVRSEKLIAKLRSVYPKVEWRLLDAESGDVGAARRALEGASWIVNAVGKIKPYIRDDNPVEVETAIKVNSSFPYVVAHALAADGARILQIATDCVYSGKDGKYVENSKHDSLDVYGKTKSLGECALPNFMHLRCSIIGPEPKGYVSLLDWFRRQPKGAQLNGYRNHFWNGVTTLHFAKLCGGIIHGGLFRPGVQHVVPGDSIAKADLLECFKADYRRPDIAIKHVEVVPVVDRTLSTVREAENRALWAAAGHERIPTVREMVSEMARVDFHMEGALN
jgi:dTDP-4-dehydrorhamnose reductase